jgi:hypothetical protein
MFSGSFWAGALFTTSMFAGIRVEGSVSETGGVFWRGEFWKASLFSTDFFRGVPVVIPVPPKKNDGGAWLGYIRPRVAPKVHPPVPVIQYREDTAALAVALLESDELL